MMIGAGVSRWTMLHLGSAVVAFLVAETLLAAGYADPLDGLRAPATLVAVHLITIGWLSLLMLGALYQFVPVITTTSLFSQRLPILSFCAIVPGLAAMLVGFLALDGVAYAHIACLPIGGALVLTGFILGAINVAMTLWRARPLPLPAVFVAFGLGFLLLTGLAGLCFALAFALPNPPRFLLALAGQGLLLHVVAGLGGWFTLTAMGVSYRLLSMFMLAPDEPRPTSYAALGLTAGGLFLLIATGLFGIAAERPMAVYEAAGALIAGIGAALYLADIVHLYRARKRRHLELNSITAAGALALFAVAVAGSGLAAAFGGLERFAGALGYLFVFGWLSGLGLSQLYKIVPFLTWLEVFGKRLGKGPVPRVQDLVDEPRARPWFILYFSAVLFGTAALVFASAILLRFAAVAQLVATGFIALELWRARRPDPDAAPKPMGQGAPLPFARPIPPSNRSTHGG
ncbi:MAG TPA: hypothetical protein PKA57_12595 [Parvibaculum sp.]|uniref:hypothetical protein n=1 Tax=Parvibaculum sp. TaxID=2024848 RepID=UPI002B53D772|nr:hypothetical protein [Parvibaculum sp.]HMM15459.1 hypothetical protein [Parvibaculum sp.]